MTGLGGRRGAVLVGLVLGVACQSAPLVSPPVVGQGPPIQWWAATDGPAPSPFYVVVEGRDGDGREPSSLRLCPVSDAVFLCDPALRFDVGGFTDPGTTGVTQVTGRWPQRLWGTRPRDCGGRPACARGDHLLAWHQQGWSPVGLIPYDRAAGDRYTLQEWQGQPLALVTAQAQQRVVVLGEGAELPSSLYEDRVLEGMQPVGPGQMVVWGTVGHDQFLERWVDGQRVDRISVPDGSWRFRVTIWPDLVALHRRERHALEFDGERWSALALPEWGRRVLDRARDGSDEWVVMASDEAEDLGLPEDSRLFLRVGTGEWHEVPMPPPRFAPPGNDAKLLPTHLYVVGTADVWVRAHYAVGCVDRGVILHSQSPTTPCFLERHAQLCTDQPVPRPPRECGDTGESSDPPSTTSPGAG